MDGAHPTSDRDPRTIDVIVVGSVNVDHIVRVPALPSPGTTVTGGTFTLQTGGKGANQAVAAARDGARVALVAVLGDDDLGRGALRALTSEGIDTTACEALPGTSTGIALIVVDEAGENQIAVASGANVALDGARTEEALGGLVTHPGSVCLIGFEVGDEALLAAAAWARRRALRVVVNPAPARPMATGLLDGPAILTPNRSEARALSDEEDPAAAAVRLASLSGTPVVVTLGAQGAILVGAPGGPPEHLAPFSVSAVDATGAGDAFNGILAAELAGGAPLRDAVRHAMAGAALSTRAPGAQAGLPRREEIRAFLASAG